MLREQPPFREHGYASRVEGLAVTRCNRATWNPSGQSAHGTSHGLRLTILVACHDFWLIRQRTCLHLDHVKVRSEHPYPGRWFAAEEPDSGPTRAVLLTRVRHGISVCVAAAPPQSCLQLSGGVHVNPPQEFADVQRR